MSQKKYGDFHIDMHYQYDENTKFYKTVTDKNEASKIVKFLEEQSYNAWYSIIEMNGFINYNIFYEKSDIDKRHKPKDYKGSIIK